MFDLTYIRHHWNRSKLYRGLLLGTGIYFVLRFLIHLYVAVDVFFPEDLWIYQMAAENFLVRADIYPTMPLTNTGPFQYSPFFALLTVPFLETWMGDIPAVIIQSVLHVLAHLAFYLTWDRIFRKMDFEEGRETLALLAPAWLLFGQFWTDLSFLNVYIPLHCSARC